MESFEKLCENEVTKYLLFVDINTNYRKISRKLNIYIFFPF